MPTLLLAIGENLILTFYLISRVQNLIALLESYPDNALFVNYWR